MQLLQPEIKRLQKEYAGDKPALQQATLALYKERGVNPAAGCLPLLLQMPVWIALFQVLQSFSANPMAFNDTCPQQGREIGPGGAFECEFEGVVSAGVEPEWNNVVARLKAGSSGPEFVAADSAGVVSGDVLPGTWLTMHPDPGVVPVGGGRVTFTVEVENSGDRGATLVGLATDTFGDLLATTNARVSNSTCPDVDRAVAAGGRATCSFEALVPGPPASSRNTIGVSATLQTESGAQATRSDRAFVDVGESHGIVVVVSPRSGMAPSGGGWVGFTVQVINQGTASVTLTSLDGSKYLDLLKPAASPTRFLGMVANGRLRSDIQDWLDAGNQPADPPWRLFAWMNLSISPQNGLALGFVSFIPYVVMLLLVMGTAYYQQKQTTPKPKDGQPAAQQPGQAILKIFPVLFGFISFTLPAGLGVYFGASSVFRIGQQYMIIRMGERRGDGKAKSAAEEAPMEVEAKALKAADPRVKAPERPARPSAVQPKTGRPVATARSPQASQQRGKKRRRR
jgi:hypothetical protein